MSDEAPTEDTAPKGLRERWASPARSGMQLVIAPYEYRHLRGCAQAHIATGVVVAGLGFVTLTAFSTKAVAWAAMFWALSFAQLFYAAWLLAIDRSASARA